MSEMNEFDAKAGEWDLNPRHIERTKAIASGMIRSLPLSADMRALEFGAGTGLLSFFLKDQFSEITLMDSSPEMLKMAEKKIKADNLVKFKTLLFNLETEEYQGDPFDIIYCQMALHHIRDTQSILHQFFQHLKMGGILAIADLYPEDGSFHQGDTTVHFGFDPEALTTLLIQQGFLDISINPCCILRKEVQAGQIREYPVFLLTAFCQQQTSLVSPQQG